LLAILQRVVEMEAELSQAQREIEGRKRAERERDKLIGQLQESREEYRELSAKLRKASRTDELTGVPNRRHFNEVLEKEWSRSARERTPLSVMIMDVDGFKAYNDNYGHLAGDDCLRMIAGELSRAFRRPADLFARFGGDEFAAILPRTALDGALTVAENCQKRLDALSLPHKYEPDLDHVTVSIGVSTARANQESSSEVIVRRADRALYKAKGKGKGQVECM
jgi:two-component system chemotaxis family response regulator WspR